jgi:hypothetical protein
VLAVGLRFMSGGNIQSRKYEREFTIEERFLHCASRRVRRSERKEKASARSGRNDRSGLAGDKDSRLAKKISASDVIVGKNRVGAR